MEAALHHLKEAKKEFESAGRDKGGHRENAMSLTNKAEAEVEAGCNMRSSMPGSDSELSPHAFSSSGGMYF
jgi:hypothetical protein